MTMKFWMGVAAAVGLALLIAGSSAGRADEQQEFTNADAAWKNAHDAAFAKQAQIKVKAANGTLTDFDLKALDDALDKERIAWESRSRAQGQLEAANWAREQKNQSAGSRPPTNSTSSSTTTTTPSTPQSQWEQVATDGKTTCFMNYTTNETRCVQTSSQPSAVVHGGTAFCIITGKTGASSHQPTAEQARAMAIADCVRNGGIHDCCLLGARTYVEGRGE